MEIEKFMISIGNRNQRWGLLAKDGITATDVVGL